jgi:hypothetical protein
MTSSKPPGNRAEITAQLNSIRPDGSSDKPIQPHNVTAVLELAIERVDAAQVAMADALTAATERLLVETEKTTALARALRRDVDGVAATEAAPPDTEPIKESE